MNKAGAGTIVVTAALALAVPLIAQWEGKSNDPYYDIVNVQTVCYGETRVDMRHYTDEECTVMLRDAVSEFQESVIECTPTLSVKPFQLAAATSLSYNIGKRGYCRSTAARRFNQGDMVGGCEAMTWYNKAGGRTVRGLVNRRNDEYMLCMTNLRL